MRSVGGATDNLDNSHATKCRLAQSLENTGWRTCCALNTFETPMELSGDEDDQEWNIPQDETEGSPEASAESSKTV